VRLHGADAHPQLQLRDQVRRGGVAQHGLAAALRHHHGGAVAVFRRELHLVEGPHAGQPGGRVDRRRRQHEGQRLRAVPHHLAAFERAVVDEHDAVHAQPQLRGDPAQDLGLGVPADGSRQHVLALEQHVRVLVEHGPHVLLVVLARQRQQEAALPQAEQELLQRLALRPDAHPQRPGFADHAVPQRVVAVERHHLERRTRAGVHGAGDLAGDGLAGRAAEGQVAQAVGRRVEHLVEPVLRAQCTQVQHAHARQRGEPGAPGFLHFAPVRGQRTAAVERRQQRHQQRLRPAPREQFLQHGELGVQGGARRFGRQATKIAGGVGEAQQQHAQRGAAQHAVGVRELLQALVVGGEPHLARTGQLRQPPGERLRDRLRGEARRQRDLRRHGPARGRPRQRVDRGVRLGRRQQQRFEVARPGRHAGGVEACGIEAQAQHRRRARQELELERVVGVLVQAHRARGRVGAARFDLRIVLEHQDVVEQGRPERVRRLHVGERTVVVRLGRRGFVAQPGEQLREAFAGLPAHPHADRVDEESDRALGARQLRRPARHGGGEGGVAPAVQAPQQHAPERLHGEAGRDLVARDERRQRLLRLRRQRVPAFLARVARRRRAEARFQPGRQRRGELQALQALAPEREAGRAVARAQPAHVGRIGCGRRQPRRLAAAARLVQPLPVRLQDRQAPAIQQDVVEAPDHPVAPAGQREQRQPHRHGARRIQPLRQVLLAPGRDHGLGGVGRVFAQVAQPCIQRGFAQHHLQGLLQVAHGEHGAQHVVPLHQVLPRLQVALRVQRPGQFEIELLEIGTRARIAQRVEQHALLQRRQRIQVGDVAAVDHGAVGAATAGAGGGRSMRPVSSSRRISTSPSSQV